MHRPMLVALGLSLGLAYGGAEEEMDEGFRGGGRHMRRCSGDECTPLLWAAALSDADSYDSAQEAIAGGADLDAVHGRHDSTALMKVSQTGRLDLVRLLLDAGAAVDVRQRDGATALMAAAQSGHTAVVALLLNAGAEPLLRSNDGWWTVGLTAYDIAFREGHADTCLLLRTAEEYAGPPAALSTSRAAADTIIGTWQQLSRKAAAGCFFLNFLCGRLILNLLGRKLLAPAGLYLPGWAVRTHRLAVTVQTPANIGKVMCVCMSVQTNILAVLLPPGASLCVWVVAIKAAGHLNDDPGRSAAMPVAVAALVGTPLLWIWILRRDTLNAAQRRARVNANAAVAAATGTSTAYRRTGSPRLRPSAPTFAEVDFRAASGVFNNTADTRSLHLDPMLSSTHSSSRRSNHGGRQDLLLSYRSFLLVLRCFSQQ